MKKEQVIMITAVLIDALNIIHNNLISDIEAPKEEDRSAAGRVINPCDKCGEEMQDGQYGLYCRPCYLDRKNKNSKR